MPSPSARPYKILSLDGGGTWALIQVRALQKLFSLKAKGHDILRHYDLVVASSGGSIVAAALFLNLPLNEIRKLFEDEKSRTAIFSPLWSNVRPVRKIGLFPRYDASDKDEGLLTAMKRADSYKPPLKHLFCDLTMHEAWATWNDPSLPHFLILAYDYERDNAHYFRSNKKSLAGTGGVKGKVVKGASFRDAVHSSSNAPVMFFDDPAEIEIRPRTPSNQGKKMRMWDGAITGYNNPVVAGVVEALANGAKPHEIAVLSIGTASDRRPIRGDFPKTKTFTKTEKAMLARTPGDPDPHLRDVLKMAKSILADPPDIASYTAHMMIGGSVPNVKKPAPQDWPVVRLNPLVAPIISEGQFITLHPPKDLGNKPPKKPISNLEMFERIVKVEMDATTNNDVRLINRLTDCWLKGTVRNQPLIATGPGGKDAHIGEVRFKDGHARAHTLGLCTKKPS